MEVLWNLTYSFNVSRVNKRINLLFYVPSYLLGFVLSGCCHVLTECSNNTYGVECKELCGHCSNGEPCQHLDGSCPSGCNAGAYGVTCKESCGNCSNGDPCNDVDGSCPNGCDVGVYGKTCDEGNEYALEYEKSLTDST